MALIDLDKPEGACPERSRGGAGTSASRSLQEARAEIAAITGSARSAYDLAKDRERDEAALREMVDRPPRLEEL